MEFFVGLLLGAICAAIGFFMLGVLLKASDNDSNLK